MEAKLEVMRQSVEDSIFNAVVRSPLERKLAAAGWTAAIATWAGLIVWKVWTITEEQERTARKEKEEERQRSNNMLAHYGANVVQIANLKLEEALQFNQKIVSLCVKHASPELGSRALHVGCAMGGASFLLAKHFKQVIAVNSNENFVNFCEMLRAEGKTTYEIDVDSKLNLQPDMIVKDVELQALLMQSHTEKQSLEATVDEDTDRERVTFITDDCSLTRSGVGQFSCVVLDVIAPQIKKSLLASLVADDGLIVIASAKSKQNEEPKQLQYDDVISYLVKKFKYILKLFTKRRTRRDQVHFQLVDEARLPFVTFDSSSVYRLEMIDVTVWRKTSDISHPILSS